MPIHMRRKCDKQESEMERDSNLNQIQLNIVLLQILQKHVNTLLEKGVPMKLGGSAVFSFIRSKVNSPVSYGLWSHPMWTSSTPLPSFSKGFHTFSDPLVIPFCFWRKSILICLQHLPCNSISAELLPHQLSFLFYVTLSCSISFFNKPGNIPKSQYILMCLYHAVHLIPTSALSLRSPFLLWLPSSS